MIAEKLRKSILQAAIQGKLTEQLPEDGDARELLAEIKAEKARLVKEGKIKKEKPLPEITEDEIPFDIPENWCWCRIGHIFTLQAGKFISSDSIKGEGKYPCYGGNGLRGYVDVCNRAGRFPLIGRQGALCGNINIADGEFYATEHAVVVQGYSNYIADWAACFLNALNLNQYATATAQPGLAVNKINQIILPLPPVAEQQRIVVAIEKTLEKIKDLKKDELKLQLLQKSFPKKMKDSLLQAAIQGKLTEQLESDGDARALVADIQKEKERLIKEGKIKKERVLPEITEDEIPFDIPDSWCWVRLGEVTDYGTGKQVNQNNIAPNSWILELEDIEKETYKLSSKRFDRKPGSSKNAFTAGDILYGKLRPYLKKVIIADESGYCSTEIIPFRGYGNINSSYLKYCMVAPTIDSYINQITHGMDMPRLGTDKAKQLVIPLPPLDEQQRIVARLELLLPLCDALE